MKKIIILPLALLFFVCSVQAYAETASNSATTPTEEASQIEKIKDLVASRVAELKLVEKKGILGNVTSSTTSQVTLTDGNNQKRIVDIDEITKFSDPDSKSFGISDIKNGDLLGIIGLSNKESEHLLARFVDRVSTIPVYFEGVITDIDRKNFQLTAVDENGNKKILDITTGTKINSFTKADGEIKSGFSKITIGQRVYAAGFMDSKIKGQLDSDRVIHFPELALSAKMKAYANVTPTVETTPEVSVKPTTSN